jgi:hypothetical protein
MGFPLRAFKYFRKTTGMKAARCCAALSFSPVSTAGFAGSSSFLRRFPGARVDDRNDGHHLMRE